MTVVIVGFLLINQLYLLPRTTVFRPRSDPGTPPAQHLVHVTFDGTFELVGYDLDPEPAHAGDLMTVRLYWRSLKPFDQSPRGSVHVTALDGQADWGGSESLEHRGRPVERLHD